METFSLEYCQRSIFIPRIFIRFQTEVAFAGNVGEEIEELYGLGITSIIGILPGVVALEEALKAGETNMERAVENIVRIL